MSGPHPSFAPAGTCLLGKTSNLTTAYCLLFKSPFAKGGFRGISRQPIKSPLPPLVQGGLKKPGDTAPSNFQRPFLVPKLQLGNPLVGKGSPPETCIMRKTRNSKLETGNWELTPGHCSRSATAAAPSPDYHENQTACRQNASAPKRRPSGTICGKNFSSGTAVPARLLTGPILTV